jgi:hypothetical protein
MRSGWRIAALGLLLALSAGCNRRQPNATPPVAAQAPSRPVWQMAQDEPMPALPPYTNDRPIMLDTSVPPEPAPVVAAAPPKRPRHHPKTSETAQQDTPKPPTQPAAPSETEEATTSTTSTQPSESSPIGQLSTASGDTNTGDRQTLLDQINAMENSLNGLHRSLSSDEQKTAALIRTFITRARDALKTDDLEGAKNYYTKAKILLQELEKP